MHCICGTVPKILDVPGQLAQQYIIVRCPSCGRQSDPLSVAHPRTKKIVIDEALENWKEKNQ